MTVNPSNTRELNIAQLVARAFNLAGLKDAFESAESATNEADGAMARDYLQMIMDALGTEGPLARQVVFYDLTLVAGTYKYTMPAHIFDVIGEGMYIDETQVDLSKASGETVVRPVDRDTWHRTSAKDATGRPYMQFVNKGTPSIQVWFWPVPDAAGTIRLQTHQFAADSDEGQYTPDLQRFWGLYLTWELAHHLAMAAGLVEKAMALGGRAQMYLTKARGKANQTTGSYLYVDHGIERQ